VEGSQAGRGAIGQEGVIMAAIGIKDEPGLRSPISDHGDMSGTGPTTMTGDPHSPNLSEALSHRRSASQLAILCQRSPTPSCSLNSMRDRLQGRSNTPRMCGPLQIAPLVTSPLRQYRQRIIAASRLWKGPGVRRPNSWRDSTLI